VYFQRDATIHIFFWKIALHVSGGISTHYQEHTQLYLQYLVLVKPLLLPAAGVGNVLICFGAVATAPKEINTIPTSHSNQFQLLHNSGK